MSSVDTSRPALTELIAEARGPVFPPAAVHPTLNARIDRLADAVEALLDEREAAVAYLAGFAELRRALDAGVASWGPVPVGETVRFGPGVASCPCRPENGDSGVCGCMLGGSSVTSGVAS